jgi:glutaredoxin
MSEILYFKLLTCPYCLEADKFITELIKENGEYGKINIKVIDEKAEAEFANTFDYYYVPTFYCDGKKLHEGASDKNKIKKVLDYALEQIKA